MPVPITLSIACIRGDAPERRMIRRFLCCENKTPATREGGRGPGRERGHLLGAEYPARPTASLRPLIGGVECLECHAADPPPCVDLSFLGPVVGRRLQRVCWPAERWPHLQGRCRTSGGDAMDGDHVPRAPTTWTASGFRGEPRGAMAAFKASWERGQP